jgi:hypothetical protein
MMMGSVDLIETNMKVTVLIQRIWGDKFKIKNNSLHR